jgi:chemotaxis protein MotB
MSVRRRRPAPENHERWLVSYADFITLLFAFFVVLFASTHADRSRAKAVSVAVDEALRDGALSPAVESILGGRGASKGHAPQAPPHSAPPHPAGSHEDLHSSLRVLARELEHEVKDQKVKLSLEDRGLVISLQEAAFFPSGEDTIKPASYPIMEKLARVLRKLPNPLRLEGHTDSVPINNSRFRDNWELSAARSIAMLHLLNERFQIDADRMAIVGYADTQAAEPETTPEARARNRRVDVVVVSPFGMQVEAAR